MIKSLFLLYSLFMPYTLQAATKEITCDYKQGPPDATVVTATDTTGGIHSAWYGNATDLYTHGVLGDSIEAHTLYIAATNSHQCAHSITLDDQSVFEDINPRIADVTGDGSSNVIVIESHIDRGASLAVYGLVNGNPEKIASTPFIGKPNRWLAPVGIADFDGDGTRDVAYVQTPHIGGILKIWSFKDQTSRLLVSAPGYSNHRIGENFITGGINTCMGDPEIVVPDQYWQKTLQISFDDGRLTNQVYANDTNATTVQRALKCP